MAPVMSSGVMAARSRVGAGLRFMVSFPGYSHWFSWVFRLGGIRRGAVVGGGVGGGSGLDCRMW
jgi:hypothetical protein